MSTKTLLTIPLLAMLVAVTLAAQVNEPAYKMEGAWSGIVTIPGLGDTPSLDTFVSDAQRQGVQGTFLCTIPALNKMPNPSNPNGWLSATPAGHGNWVRVGKNRYAFTAVRSIFDQAGQAAGWARFWGIITPISDSEYTGQMNAQYYLLNGTPISPVFTGTMHSHRIQITLEQ